MPAKNDRPREFARKLRQKDNIAEIVLWRELRDRRLHNYKFVREFPVGRYFVDFACRRHNLAVELDGSQHFNSNYDVERDQWLNRQGWGVVRFSNMLVLKEKQTVLRTMVEILEGRIWERVEGIEWRFWPRTGTRS